MEEQDLRAAKSAFLALFRVELAGVGLTETDIRRALGKGTGHRAFSLDDLSRVTLRRAVDEARKLRPDATFTDPDLLISDAEQHRWARAGALLRRLDPEFFAELLERAESVSEPLRKAEEQRAKARSDLKKKPQHKSG